jgi:hypothetical protein
MAIEPRSTALQTPSKRDASGALALPNRIHAALAPIRPSYGPHTAPMRPWRPCGPGPAPMRPRPRPHAAPAPPPCGPGPAQMRPRPPCASAPPPCGPGPGPQAPRPRPHAATDDPGLDEQIMHYRKQVTAA